MTESTEPWLFHAAPPFERGRDHLLHDRAVSMWQIVAFNLTMGRKYRGLSQHDLGQKLTQLTGKNWSAATVSAAEKSWDSRVSKRRVRQFDVNELAALALALRLPIGWFFLPPTYDPLGAPVDAETAWVVIDARREPEPGAEPRPALTSAQLHWLATSQTDPSDPDALMRSRLQRQGLTPRSAEAADGDSLHERILRRLDELERRLLNDDIQTGEGS